MEPRERFHLAAPIIQLASFTVLSVVLAISAHANTVTWSCYRNDSYTVLATDKANSVGSRFTIRKSTSAVKPDCAIETRPTDRMLGADEALFYIALRNNFLILDEGTGPDRGVAIYELGSGKRLLGAAYSVAEGQCTPSSSCLPDDFRIDGSGVVFWRAIRERADRQNCPNLARIASAGLAATIEEMTFFRFSPARLEGQKSKRCTARQAPYDGRYILDGIARGD